MMSRRYRMTNGARNPVAGRAWSLRIRPRRGPDLAADRESGTVIVDMDDLRVRAGRPGSERGRGAGEPAELGPNLCDRGLGRELAGLHGADRGADVDLEVGPRTRVPALGVVDRAVGGRGVLGLRLQLLVVRALGVRLPGRHVAAGGPDGALVQHGADELQRPVLLALVVRRLLRDDQRVRVGLTGVLVAAEDVREQRHRERQLRRLEGRDLPLALEVEPRLAVREHRDRALVVDAAREQPLLAQAL